MNRKLILKSPRFVPIGANLAQSESKSDSPDADSLYLTLRKIAIWLSKNWQKLDLFFNKIANG